MSDWSPPGAPGPAGAPQPTPPAEARPAWGQPYPAYGYAPPPPPSVPWYRSTAFLVIGGLALLATGGVAGALVAVVGLGAAESIGDGFGAELTTYGPGGDLERFGIGPGQCAAEDLVEARSYDEGSSVPCQGLHAVQHYASAEPPVLAGDDPTGVDPDDLASFADDACYLAFEPFVGLGYEDSDFDYTPIVPTEAAWDAGSRTVHCVLYEYDGSASTGSAAGSRR